MLVFVVAATGLCGIALELILVFMFQSLLGYVYSKAGLMLALFMAGLALGAFKASLLMRKGARAQWFSAMAADFSLIGVAACIPWLLVKVSSETVVWIPWGWIEAMIYALMAWTGAMVGAQFALVNEIMSRMGCAEHCTPTDAGGLMPDEAARRGWTAAITNAADLAGAAAGGLAVGVFLLPLFGMASTCLLLAIVKLSSLLCLLAAYSMAHLLHFEKSTC